MVTHTVQCPTIKELASLRIRVFISASCITIGPTSLTQAKKIYSFINSPEVKQFGIVDSDVWEFSSLIPGFKILRQGSGQADQMTGPRILYLTEEGNVYKNSRKVAEKLSAFITSQSQPQ